jgi:hypothetical protein
MSMSLRRLSWVLSLVLVIGLVAAPSFAAKKNKRYGIEGVVTDFDEASSTVMVKVAKTKVSGQFGSGGVAGGKPPKSVKRGANMKMAVVPEGSSIKA